MHGQPGEVMTVCGPMATCRRRFVSVCPHIAISDIDLDGGLSGAVEHSGSDGDKGQEEATRRRHGLEGAASGAPLGFAARLDTGLVLVQ